MATLPVSIDEAMPAHWAPLCVSRLHFHVTWTTRRRRPVLRGGAAHAAREILTRLAEERGLGCEAVTVLRDRVHLLLSLRPQDSAGNVVRELKGRSALELFTAQPELRVRLGGNLLWGETYAIATVSPRTLPRRAEKLRHLEDRDLLEREGSAPCSRS